MSSSIERREARLLRWESYLRRTRHVAFWLGIMGIVMPLGLGALHVIPVDHVPQVAGAGLFFLVWAYEAHLKVRHIESIKFHRRVDATSPADN